MCIVEFLDNHTWAANLLGIFVSAGIAIGVMDKNHKKSDEIEERKIKNQSNLNINKGIIHYANLLTMSASLHNSYIRTYSEYINVNDINVLKISVEEMEYHCKNILGLEVINNFEYHQQMINGISEILNEIRYLKSNVIYSGVKNALSRDVILSLRKIALKSEEILRKTPAYTFRDEFVLLDYE